MVFSSDNRRNLHHHSHTDLLVLQEHRASGDVSGSRRRRLGGEGQTSHRKRPRKQWGLRHSKGIREWSTLFCWQLYSLQMLPTLNTEFSTFIIWYYKYTLVLNGARANCAWLLYDLSWRQMLIKRCPAVLCCFSDGPHAFCQQSWLWVPEWERRLWLRELLKQRAVLPGVWLRWAGISCWAHLPPTSKSLLFSVIANANPEKSRHFNSVVQLLREWMNGY